MNSNLLYNCLASDVLIRPWIRGIYAIDMLPCKVMTRPALYIINSDLSNSPGQHWFTVFFPETDSGVEKCEFMDSLGRHPSFYRNYLLEFIKRNSDVIIINGRCLQSDTSSVCGHYALYFSYFRCRNVCMECILSKDHFALDPNVNDLNVYNFTRTHFPMLKSF